MLDYETLRVIWWCLVGVLLIGFAVTDGFDLGVGALLRIVGRTDEQRRVMINSIGPHWDGNQVWFITAGGALFAAWPLVYAAAFSGLYLALAVTLIALWMRPIGFDYRSKLPNKQWRNAWDWALFAGGLIPALIFGVAFGNLLVGLPFSYDETLRPAFDGNFFDLLNPFSILAGLVSITMLLAHGANWLQMKTHDDLLRRSQAASFWLSLVTIILFMIGGLWLTQIDGHLVQSIIDTQATSNPTNKVVTTETGAWLNNYSAYPAFVMAPTLAILAGIMSALYSYKGRSWQAFLMSSLMIAGIILTAGLSMFPFLMPSSVDPNVGLTLWDATSSEMTLKTMFIVACIFVPIVLSYTVYSFYVMRGKIRESELDHSHTIY